MKNRKNIIRIVIGMIIIAVAASTVFDFSRQLQGALTNETYRTLSEVSKSYNRAFEERITYNIKAMNVLAGSFYEANNMSKQEIRHVLKNAVKVGGFTRMAICNMQGISYADDGVEVDVSDRNYFKKAMADEINISEPIISRVDGMKKIVIALPIKENTKVTGVLLGVYPIATAGKQLLESSYYSDGYGAIISRDGNIILANKEINNDSKIKNLYTFFEKGNMINYSMKELKAAINSGESYRFEFEYKNEKLFASFMPSTVNDWYTFSIVSEAFMMQQKKNTGQMVLQLSLKIILIALLLLAWIVMGNKRHNKELHLANQKYQSLLDNINGGVVVATEGKNPDQIIANHVSLGFTNMTGYTLEDINEMHQGRYLDLIYEEDLNEAFEMHRTQILKGNVYRIPYRIRKKDGSLIWVMDNGYLVNDEEGLHNHSILTDITTIKEQEQELVLSEKRFSIAINASSGTLFEVDLKNQTYTHFENAERIFGVKAEKLIEDANRYSNLPLEEYRDAITKYFFHPDDCAVTKNAMIESVKTGKVSYEARLRRQDNSYIWARIDLSIFLDEFGKPSRLVGYMSDIDEIKKRADMLENKVQTDPMTGLYNKVAVATLTGKIINETPNGVHALIVLDIDNFKGINDTLGHAFGDVVLIEACAKLKDLFRNDDIVGRMGGDEFAVVMKNIPDTSGVLKKATEISATFRQTYTGEKGDYKISCSMGIVIINGSNESFEKIYRKADAALYKAKQNGKDQFVLYQEEEADSYPVISTRTNDEELENLKVSSNIEEHIFELLYATKDFNISVNMALSVIGQQYHVSRVYIFENSEGNKTISNIYEWCSAGVSSEIANLKNVEIYEGEESLLDSFDQKGLFYCNNVSELTPYKKKSLEEQGVMATLQKTIVDGDKIYGFIGFDECKSYRVWTSEEIEKISFLAKILSVFLFKKKAEANVLENLNTRLKILDVLPDYLCVVNPETHTLEYANNKMQELLPSAQNGVYCYRTLRGGQESPCETCLMERIKRGDTDNLEIVSEDRKTKLKVKALLINWSNEQKMVLLYGTTESKV
ncbi:MAG: diguanylate cyclase [Anaerovoracaceae bacterium]